MEDDGVYRATYTAFDGASVAPQMIETADFRRFRMSRLAGPAARNKGMALFPRRVGGRYVALSRWDRENNAIATSVDGVWWDDPRTLQTPSRPWELLQLGNCGSPIETEAGWIVVTHGVGPMREYAIGALLLDLDDPSRVIGALRDPLLAPADDERDGYVPNVVYSCGALRHGDQLLLPYGASDASVRFAFVDMPLARRATDGRRATGHDAGEQLRVVRHHPRRGEALLDVVPAVPSGTGNRPGRPPRPRRRRRRRGSRCGRARMISGIDPSGYAITGVPVANDSTTESPNGSAKPIRCSNASAPPSSASRSAGPTGPDVGDAGRREMRFDQLPEVALILDDPGDDQRQPGPARDLDRPMGALVGMDAAEEQQVVPGLIAEGERGEVDAVVDRRGVGQVRVPVRIADRDVVPDVVVGAVDRHDPLRREAVDRWSRPASTPVGCRSAGGSRSGCSPRRTRRPARTPQRCAGPRTP